jgi:hypothetical protein
MTFLRWLFFLMVTLGPAIKLIAMDDVPWSKAWGSMFLCSFMILEYLVVLSWNRSQNRPIEDSGNADALPRTNKPLRNIDSWIFRIALAAHGLLLFYAVSDLWPVPSDHPLINPPTSFNIGKLIYHCFALTEEFIYLLMLMGTPSFLLDNQHSGHYDRLYVVVVIFPILFLCFMLWVFPGYIWLAVDFLVVISIAGPLFVFVIVAPKLFERFPSILRNLLLKPH